MKTPVKTSVKIVADRDIPFLKGVLEPFARVVYLPGNAISAADVRDADAILTRTRTRCDEMLLKNSRVKFIGTATIGFDHIDRAWCEANDITVCTSAGCNARGVLQWVAAALAWLAETSSTQVDSGVFASSAATVLPPLSPGRSERTSLVKEIYSGDFLSAPRDGSAKTAPVRSFLSNNTDITIGVVGVGNVGSLVSEYAADWGFRVMRSDPPREKTERLGPEQGYFSLDQIAQKADIITFHVPLDASTRHLVDRHFLALTKPDAVILNSSRGPVIDPETLRYELAAQHPRGTSKSRGFILDVWNDEPAIDRGVLAKTLLATPHIAGYSMQGKANATAMAVNQLARFFNLPIEPIPLQSAARKIAWDEMCASINDHFDIAAQSLALKQNPENFEQQRDNYRYREEFF